MPEAPDAATVLASVLRQDRGRILSALIARMRDFQSAEDALHEAAAAALAHWGRSGIPERPDAWLIRVAFRKAIDMLRTTSRAGQGVKAMAVLARDEAMDAPELIADERLRLIFTCCHPALASKSRVALTLRCVCGLSTGEIAHAFLDAEPAMGQRLARAKTKIAEAGIPFTIPEPEHWPERLRSVLDVVYLIFNTGYTVGPGEPRDLCDEAIYLARLIDQLRRSEPETEGCLALMLLTHARSAARVAPNGESIAITDQNRGLWNAADIAEGLALLQTTMKRSAPGPHQIKAAIAACHMTGPAPDWPQILLLYDSLLRFEPTPVVALNRAVALAETGMLEIALSALDALQDALASYQPFHAAMAELQSRNGNRCAAMAAYAEAIRLAASSADAAFLIRKRNKLLN